MPLPGTRPDEGILDREAGHAIQTGHPPVARAIGHCRTGMCVADKTGIDAGKLTFASGTSITPSPDGLKRLYANIGEYRKKILLRPQEVSNSPEVARRLGVIAMNTAIELDVFGHVNSTHIMGSKMMNGIGGSGDYARNAYLTVFCTNSIAKGGAISSIVPMCSHIDHTEHDTQIFVTERGLADVRGLSPKERAREIINKCAHPDYQPLLMDYLERAERITGRTHTPHR